MALNRDMQLHKEHFGLHVKIDLTFRGRDAREARRRLYKSIKRFEAIFCDFSGPKDPIIMSFYAAAGNMVADFLGGVVLPSWNCEDLEVELRYRCEKDPSHSGRHVFGSYEKKGIEKILGLFRSDDTGQTTF